MSKLKKAELKINRRIFKNFLCTKYAIENGKRFRPTGNVRPFLKAEKNRLENLCKKHGHIVDIRLQDIIFYWVEAGLVEEIFLSDQQKIDIILSVVSCRKKRANSLVESCGYLLLRDSTPKDTSRPYLPVTPICYSRLFVRKIHEEKRAILTTSCYDIPTASASTPSVISVDKLSRTQQKMERKLIDADTKENNRNTLNEKCQKGVKLHFINETNKRNIISLKFYMDVENEKNICEII